MADEVYAAAVRIELRIPYAESLKAKRAVLRPFIAGLRRFEVSVAECASQDAHRRAVVGVAVVGGRESEVRERIAVIERWIWAQPEVEVVEVEVGWCEF